MQDCHQKYARMCAHIFEKHHQSAAIRMHFPKCDRTLIESICALNMTMWGPKKTVKNGKNTDPQITDRLRNSLRVFMGHQRGFYGFPTGRQFFTGCMDYITRFLGPWVKTHIFAHELGFCATTGLCGDLQS